MSWWSGYRRHVRVDGVCHRIFVPRVRCGACEKTHALLPAFVLVGRLDVAETIGQVLDEVVDLGEYGLLALHGQGGGAPSRSATTPAP